MCVCLSKSRFLKGEARARLLNKYGDVAREVCDDFLAQLISRFFVYILYIRNGFLVFESVTYAIPQIQAQLLTFSRKLLSGPFAKRKGVFNFYVNFIPVIDHEVY